jgi:prevent-host-death family protein
MTPAPRPPLGKINTTQLQREIGTVMRRVAVGKERLVVEREGYPVAVMLPYPDYEALIRQAAGQELVAVLDEMQRGNEAVSEEEVAADVSRAIRERRQRRRSSKK